ncbi:MAG: SDR family oxidoreductase [Pelagibacteraceae bacterium TMED124]|nr:MAG: SDR family oxidoreductase [Pelagibacteraceae bacterium TMED124]
MKKDLSNYHIFFAGGTGSIGKVIVKYLLDYNTNITVLTQSNKKLNIQNFNLNCIKVNYGEYDQLVKIFNKHGRNGKINCLVSTVGSGKMLGSYPYKNQEVKRIWDINYFYNRNLAIAASEVIKNNDELNPFQSSSHILTSSIASITNVKAPIEYSNSKIALENLVKSLSILISPKQRINAIRPGHIYTEDGVWGEKLKSNKEKVNDIISKEIPLLRLGNPNDLLSLILFLLTTDSSYITGTCINVDGGLASFK